MARIFISHSNRDANTADRLCAWLRSEGFEDVFLDIDKHAGIQPGADWERTLYRELSRAHAVVLIVTANWHASRWCWAEFTQARALGKAVFPIIETPSGETLIASDIQHLDLTSDREGGLERLASALNALTRDRHDFPWDASRSPYPGLLALHEEDAAIYFGRDDEIRRLIERLNARRTQGGARLLVLLGASGSGKSSLLRAGLLPRLKRDRRSWVIIPPVRTRLHPIDELAAALAAAFGDGRDWRSIRDLLADETQPFDPLALGRDLRAAGANLDAQILVTIDQFEELFSAHDQTVVDHYLRVLSRLLADDSPFLAVAGLRSDYLSTLQSATQLGVRFEEVSLRPLAPERIPEIIAGPARVAGLHVEDALIARATADASTSDTLPLLAFALRELYERYGARANALQLDDYLRLGDPTQQLNPLESAVRRAADETLDAMNPTPNDLEALRAAFVSGMVRIDDEGEFARRTALWTSLPEPARPILERLAQARLLTIDHAGGHKTVEVAHEALLRKWPRLRAWLDEERDFLVGRSQLEHAFRDWTNADDTARTQALLQGLPLARASEWLARHPTGIPAEEQQFIRLSRDAAERRARRVQRQRSALIASSTALIGLLLFGGSWAYGVIVERLAVAREAVRVDLEGTITALAASPGQHVEEGRGSPQSRYTSALIPALQQPNTPLIKALADAHGEVLRGSDGRQRPLLATDLNGHVYLWRQPKDRLIRALIISVDQIGDYRFDAPKRDADAVVQLLKNAGFSDAQIMVLHNPSKAAVLTSVQSLQTAALSDQQGIADPPRSLTHAVSSEARATPVSIGITKPAIERKPNSLLLLFYSGYGMTHEGRRYLSPALEKHDSRTLEASDLIDFDAMTADLSTRFSIGIWIVDSSFQPLR